MRSDWREFSGFGELLCLVLAWAVGMGAVWADYATRDSRQSGNRVADGAAPAGAGSQDE